MNVENTTIRNRFSETIKQFNTTIDKFNSEESVNHVIIKNIRVGLFSLPTILDTGAFESPKSGRKEYEHIIQSHWKDLKDVWNPCVYVFELVSPEPNTVLLEYNNYLNDQRNSLCMRRSCSSPSKLREGTIDRTTLYVGKSEKPIDGRIVVHFGYYEKGVAGLQLVHWANRIPDLTLNLHVFELIDRDLHPYLEVFEKLLFTQLRPLIGNR